jgi:hypothetical protein
MPPPNRSIDYEAITEAASELSSGPSLPEKPMDDLGCCPKCNYVGVKEEFEMNRE